jgi:DNA-nicking Smr family endonuclease
MDPEPPGEPVRIPITGELDLHAFRPAEVGDLLHDYLRECAARGIRVVRVVHGKGSGALRERVHAWLRRSPRVESFALCDETAGGWGATRVVLRPPDCGRVATSGRD